MQKELLYFLGHQVQGTDIILVLVWLKNELRFSRSKEWEKTEAV